MTPLRLQYRCSARRCHPTPPRCPLRPSLLRSCAEADLQLRLPKPSAHKGKQREPGGTRHENGKKRHPALLTWRKKLPFQTSHVPLRAWKLSGNLKLHFPACPGKQFGLPEAWSPKSTTPGMPQGTVLTAPDPMDAPEPAPTFLTCSPVWWPTLHPCPAVPPLPPETFPVPGIEEHEE